MKFNNQDYDNWRTQHEIEEESVPFLGSRQYFLQLKKAAQELNEEALLLSIQAGEVTKEAEELLTRSRNLLESYNGSEA